MIENHQVNLFNSKYNPTKGILQFTVFFDHPVAGQYLNSKHTTLDNETTFKIIHGDLKKLFN